MAYTTVAELRGLDGLADTSVYPDAVLQQGIDYATKLIDDYCGTSFEYKAFTVTKDGNGNIGIPTGVLYLRTLTTVTIDGVTVPTSGWKLRPEGVVVRTDGYFPFNYYGQNVVIIGTAGVTTTASEDIKLAARSIARQFCLDLHSRLPSRALQLSNEYGQVEMYAQAGGPGRPTSLPEVNAILNRNKHKPGSTGAVMS